MFKTTVVEVVPSVGAISQSWCLISCVQSSFLVWKALVNLAFSPIEFGALALHLYCYPCLSLQWKKSWLSSLSCTVDFGKSECFWDSSLSHSFVTPEGRRGSSVFFFFSLIPVWHGEISQAALGASLVFYLCVESLQIGGQVDNIHLRLFSPQFYLAPPAQFSV